jgi:hypothetical protein
LLSFDGDIYSWNGCGQFGNETKKSEISDKNDNDQININYLENYSAIKRI